MNAPTGKLKLAYQSLARAEAREAALQQRLTVADEREDHNARVSAIAVEDVLLLQKRVDVLEGLLRTSLVAMSRIYSAGRDFIIGAGCDCDSVDLMMENDPTAREIRAALKPAEGSGDE